MVRVLPLHFGVVLGCKGGGRKEKQIRYRKEIQAQTFQAKL